MVMKLNMRVLRAQAAIVIKTKAKSTMVTIFIRWLLKKLGRIPSIEIF